MRGLESALPCTGLRSMSSFPEKGKPVSRRAHRKASFCRRVSAECPRKRFSRLKRDTDRYRNRNERKKLANHRGKEEPSPNAIHMLGAT